MQKFPRYFGKPEFDMESTDTDVTCRSGQFTKIGSHTVSAQQQIAVGIGQIAGGVDSRKKGYLRVDGTGGTQIYGKLRIAIANANETDIRYIIEDVETNWSAGVEIAETQLRAREDSIIAIYLNPDASSCDSETDTIVDMSDTNNDVRIPVTVYQ